MQSVKNYKRKPTVVEAIQWDGTNWSEIVKWGNDSLHLWENKKIIMVYGESFAVVGDFIAMDAGNNFAVIPENYFREYYEEL
jgi:hypothetical protein